MNESLFFTRSCPSCGSDATGKRVKARVDPLEMSTLELNKYWRGFRRDAAFFDYVRCNECGLMYCDQYLCPELLATLYASMPDNTAGAKASVLAETQRSYVTFLHNVQPLVGTYLEVGPDIGLAAAAAEEVGTIERAILVEPNRDVHLQLAAAVTTPSLIVDTLADLAGSEKADCALLVHVLDHLVDPRPFLRELSRHLNPRAHILIVTHDENSLLRYLMGRHWPPFCLQHPQLFRRATLDRLLSSEGYFPRAFSKAQNTLPLRHFVAQAMRVIGLNEGWSRFAPDITLRIRLGNLISVASA